MDGTPGVDSRASFPFLFSRLHAFRYTTNQDTNYFEEIGHAFPNSKIRLWITGPEVGRNAKPRAMEVPNMELRIKKW